MIRHLKSLGSDRGLIIEAPILELLGIDEHTPLQISTDGEALIIRPVRAEATGRLATRTPARGKRPTAEPAEVPFEASRVLAAAERLMDEHDETFRKLAQ